MTWEELPEIQALPGFHPFLRFGSWNITRFDKGTTYMFKTPDMVQQGQFRVADNQYTFRAVMANELENADKAKLADEMGAGADGFNRAYARSMANFEGSFDPASGSLTISYRVDGAMKQFDLYPTNVGDDTRGNALTGAEAGVAGIWQAPDPFPERLDAKTRSKIEENGLKRFMDEASQSDAAQFAVLDIRTDHTFRIHEKVGRWQRKGAKVEFSSGNSTVTVQISPDSRKLLGDGRTLWVR